jgi:hypothetical protein
MDFPIIPNPHALAVLLLTVLALILFTREKIALESVARRLGRFWKKAPAIALLATLSVILFVAYDL